tara:strand:+ start:1528 stop:1788 length:261 start_codon:yes stop_codon:yes gene_type:complete
MNDIKNSVFLSNLLLSLLAICIATIAIELYPLSKQASTWNRCLKKTSQTLKQVKTIQLMDDKGLEVLSVMICNGAVFEPKFKNNNK